MGLFGGIIVYGFGKRRGRKQEVRRSLKQNVGAGDRDFGRHECNNYYRFCRGYGSCDGMTCEYGE